MLSVRQVTGPSMYPTLREGSLVLARRSGHGGRSLRKGDVVVFRHDGMEKIKRIAHLDNESMFVVGDNPAMSTDSRVFGRVPLSSVEGKVIWPKAARNQ